jgi:L-threonylcarbamoyladenylate synthase
MPSDAKRYGQMLYAVLRLLDQANSPLIIIELPPNSPQWMAIQDRISKATHKD